MDALTLAKKNVSDPITATVEATFAGVFQHKV